MRGRVLAATAAAAVVVLLLLRTMPGPGAGDAVPQRARAPRPAREAGEPSALAPAALRNVFEYADVPARDAAPAPRVAAATPPPGPVILQPEPSPSPRVRLVGLIRRGGHTRAALAVSGDTIVLAAGESASGYTVVEIDEDEGVRVRTPEGETLVLATTRER